MIKIWCHAKCYDGFAHPDAQFAMSFGVKAGSNIYSLRSSEDIEFLEDRKNSELLGMNSRWSDV